MKEATEIENMIDILGFMETDLRVGIQLEALNERGKKAAYMTKAWEKIIEARMWLDEADKQDD